MTVTATRTARPATDPQKDMITRLMGERVTGTYPGTPDDMTLSQASNIISWLLTLPKVATTVAPAAEGYYVRDGEVFVIVISKSSGKPYAKRMTIDPTGGTGYWAYAPGMGANIAAEGLVPLTVEEAARLGHHHGICMLCGRTLTVEKSVAAGIGPRCAKRL